MGLAHQTVVDFLHGVSSIQLPFHCRRPLTQHGQSPKAQHIHHTPMQCVGGQPQRSAVQGTRWGTDFSPVLSMASQKQEGMAGLGQPARVIRKEIAKQGVPVKSQTEDSGDGINAKGIIYIHERVGFAKRQPSIPEAAKNTGITDSPPACSDPVTFYILVRMSDFR